MPRDWSQPVALSCHCEDCQALQTFALDPRLREHRFRVRLDRRALVLEGAETLACYEHPHLGRRPAITSHAHGAGRVTYVGMLPDRATGRMLKLTPKT